MIVLKRFQSKEKGKNERRRKVKKESALERTKETRRRKKARKGKALAGYQQHRLAMLAVDGVSISIKYLKLPEQ